MRSVVLMMLAVWVAACRPSTAPKELAPEPAVAVETRPLRVMSWNVKYLRENQSKTRRTAPDYAQLRKYVERTRPDIVALQEIENVNAAHLVFDAKEWHVECTLARNVQRVCFAARTDRGITWTRHPDVTAINTTGTLREGLDVTFTVGDVPLRILNVHLKAGCKGTRDMLTSVGDACTKLRSQVPPLAAWIDARTREQRPFLVAGDFNRELLHPDDQMWAALNQGRLTNVAEGHTPNCWDQQKPQFIDHILADPKAAAMLVPGSFYEMQYEQSERHAPNAADVMSDHCPIMVDFRLENDRGHKGERQ